MITWLFNVVTARFHHWNVENNNYVAILVDRARTFPPAIAALFVQFACASQLVVEFLVGPHMGRKRIMKKNVRSISSEQFRSAHHLNIWAFVALFGYQNPNLRDSFFAACDDFIGITDSDRQLVNEVLAMEKLDVAKICSPLFHAIARVLDYRGGHLLDWFLLTPCFSLAYSQALEAYKKEIAELGRVASAHPK